MISYRRGRMCPACLRDFDSAPVFEHDRGFCCGPCANGHLCTCLVEVDANDDGVDRLGGLSAAPAADFARPLGSAPSDYRARAALVGVRESR
jgi:hypothetical protein